MKNREIKLRFLGIIIIHLFYFIFIVNASLSEPLILIFISILEVFIFISIWCRRDCFYLLWQLQFFFFLMFSILFNPTGFFQVREVEPTVIAFFIFILVVVESIVLSYMIFKERAVKGILLTLSSSTVVSVFLIVLFVMNEGLPAFHENNPIEFLTGTEWQPFYDTSSSYSQDIETIVQPYNFSIEVEDSSIFISPNSSLLMPLRIVNSGGEEDTYRISVSSSLKCYIKPVEIKLLPGESEEVNLRVNTSEEGVYTVEVKGVSENTSVERTVEITCMVSYDGVDLYPDTQTITGRGAEACLITTYINITNTGCRKNTFTISIDSPTIFKPSIKNISWNYTTSSGVVELEAGETKKLPVFTRLVSRIPGRYSIYINATSTSGVRDEAEFFFTYEEESYLRIEEDSKTIPVNGTANYTILIHNPSHEQLTLRIDNLSGGWNAILRKGNTTLLQGVGEVNVTFPEKTSVLTLSILHRGGENVSHVTVTIMIGGTKPVFGILPFIVGTILTTFIAIIIAAPLGVGVAIFLAEYCSSNIRRFLRPLYELLAGIPSVIYGLWGFLTFGPFLAEHVYPFISGTIGRYIGFFSGESLGGRCLLTASIILAFMILPIILTLSEDAIRSVRRELKEASLALGATKWQTIRRVVLPSASSGIISSIILGTGRAIGETMAVLMIMQYTTNIPTTVFQPAGTMTSVIAALLGSTFSSDLTRHALFAIGTTLFFMIFILNTMVFLMNQRKSNLTKKPVIENLSNLRGSLKKYIGKISYKTAVSNVSMKDKGGDEWILLEENHKNRLREKNSFKKNVAKRAVREEKIMKTLLVIGAVVVTLFLFLLLGDVVAKGGLSIKPQYFFKLESFVHPEEGGIMNAIVGSIQLVVLAIGIAAPLSIGSAIYVEEYAKSSNIFTKIILFTSDTLASTPSIVFGAFGFIFFVWYLRFGASLVAGGLTLALMVIPLMLRSSIEAIKSVPKEYREGSLALGATKWQTIRRVVLPPAMPMIVSGVIISIGRAIGETAAVIFTAGYSTHLASSLLHPVASLPNLIYNYYEVSTTFPVLGERVYSSAFVLIMVVLLLNTLARVFPHLPSKLASMVRK